ncbi:protein phosphatase CheZ [Undibacterium sp. TJN25]|uniref:protein phosphatase CheZ n=1 Tax=Undibacterium sp. TJN25 TaxID=3413056 RepID=UPI003BEF7E94
MASQRSESGSSLPQFPSDTPVFERLGDIIRALHDTLTEIGADNVLSEAASEFPSARERLQHIGNLTEKAANTVLNKVEQTMPLQERLGDTAEKLQAEWAAAGDAHPLAARTAAFLAESQATGATTYQALSEIMMAQDFQDLTGQLIKKVVSLIERTENDLLKLLIDAAPPGTMSLIKKDELMAGPGAAGGIALEQSSVDDLLADLGF